MFVLDQSKSEQNEYHNETKKNVPLNWRDKKKQEEKEKGKIKLCENHLLGKIIEESDIERRFRKKKILKHLFSIVKIKKNKKR